MMHGLEASETFLLRVIRYEYLIYLFDDLLRSGWKDFDGALEAW